MQPSQSDPNAPVLVRITKGPDGAPRVTPENIVVLPDQEVIFMSKYDFNLDFIGLSPVDLKTTGRKDFKSKDKDVIFKSTGKSKKLEANDYGEYISELKKSNRLEKVAGSEEKLKKKLPVVTSKSVEIFYNIEIDGVILDPKYTRVREG